MYGLLEESKLIKATVDKFGKLHSFNDEPSLVYSYYSSIFKVWHKHGKHHRSGDKPASIVVGSPDRTWYKDGKRHREGDKPASISYDGNEKSYYKNGKLHREGDKAAIVYLGKGSDWYKHGKRHRGGDKPAFIRGKRQLFYKHGKQYFPEKKKVK